MKNTKRLYLAYGSNMHEGQMSYRCPRAKLIGKTVIKGYELLFKGHRDCAVATIEPKEGAEVPVLIWDIQPSDERTLDIYEGFPRLYIKQDFEVEFNGETITAMAYVMTPGRVFGVPSEGYYQTIHTGYKEHGISTKGLYNALRAANRRAREN